MAGLEDELAALDGALKGVLQAAPAAVVQQALAEAVQEGVVPEVRGMFASSKAALNGTSEAISHYEAGDLAMAATAMRNAASALPADQVRKPVHPY